MTTQATLPHAPTAPASPLPLPRTAQPSTAPAGTATSIEATPTTPRADQPPTSTTQPANPGLDDDFKARRAAANRTTNAITLWTYGDGHRR